MSVNNCSAVAEDKKSPLSEGLFVGNLHTLNSFPIRVPYKSLTRNFFVSGLKGAGLSATVATMLKSLVDDWMDSAEETRFGFTFAEPLDVKTMSLVVEYLKTKPKNPLLNAIHFVDIQDIEQPEQTNLPILSWMDSGHIVFVSAKSTDTKKSGEYIAELIRRYYEIAYTRQFGARHHFLIVNDFEHVPVAEDTVRKIICECRKFGLSFGLVASDVTKLSPGMRDEIQFNCAVIASVRQGKSGAECIENLTHGLGKEGVIAELDDNEFFVLAHFPNGHKAIALCKN